MIAVHHRAANDADIKALTNGPTSLGRNLVTASLPVATVAFGIVYAIGRSAMTASIIAIGLFFASLTSNIHLFRDSKRRENLRKDANAVEVFEVSASSSTQRENLVWTLSH